MRILLDYRPALRERTGVGEVVHQLASALVRHAAGGADEVLLFSSSWKDRLSDTRVPGATVLDARVPVRWLNLAWHRLEWPPVERLAGRDLDIVHSPHPLLIPSTGATQIVTVHDLDFLQHPERTTREIRRDYPRLAGPHARRAARVVVPSRYTAGLVERLLLVAPERIVVAPHGAPDWPAREQEPSGGYVLFLGSLEPRKNLPGLLAAYGRLRTQVPDCPPLWIAGKGSAETVAQLSSLVDASASAHVRFLGYVEPDARRELYEGARLLALPSLDEGFGLPALEAMAIGVPVVAADRGALPEVVGDAGLMADPEDAGAFAGAMARVLLDHDLSRALAARGLARASLFTWDRTATIVRAAYADALAERATVDRPGPARAGRERKAR